MGTQLSSNPEYQVSNLITSLGDQNRLVRQQARLLLVQIGHENIQALLEALKSKNTNTRWEAAKVLGEIGDSQTASALTSLLMDEDAGVRWAAADALIGLKRNSLRSLLEGFIHNFDSPWYREGLHHILHVFRDRGLLRKEELAVFTMLNKQDFPGFETGWTGEGAWAAEKALEVLDREND